MGLHLLWAWFTLVYLKHDSGKSPARHVDPLACLLAFSATGLLVSGLAVMMQVSDPFDVLLKVVPIGATAPVAALTGVAVGRHLSRKQGGSC